MIFDDFTFCLIFFFFFPRKLILLTDFQDQDLPGIGRPRGRVLESANDEIGSKFLPAGETGDDSVTLIPFQVGHFPLNQVIFRW